MTKKTNVTTIDATTGEVIETVITSEEEAEIEAVSNQFKAVQEEIEAKEAARTSALAKLAALGLTEEEVAAL
jgi:acyl-CoA reductase-like NAD-dependent aldehyde dehydrogenase